MNKCENRVSELARETEAAIIDRVLDRNHYELHVFDIRPVLEHLKNHEFRSFVLARVKEEIGIDDIDLGDKITNNTERLVDIFLIWMINSFEQCWVMCGIPWPLIDERTWLATSPIALKAAETLYGILVIPDSASGRYVRVQRIGTALYLVIPK